MKFKKGNHIVEVIEENTFGVFIREGFEPVEDDERDALIQKAKELGIKSPHFMSVEKLKEKIAEQ